MSYWLGLVLREHREAQRVSRLKVANHLEVDPSTIVRLEKGGNVYTDDLDRYLAGYAEILDIEDGRTLWRESLDRWEREGMSPVATDPAGRAAAVERLTAETAKRGRARLPQSKSGPSGGSSRPKRNRPAAG